MIANLSFKPTDHGWSAIIPAERGLFQGHPLVISIHTRVLADTPNKLPLPSEAQVALATHLLENLDELIFRCAKRLKDYCSDPTFFTEMVPEIWIPSDDERETTNEWTLVVERRTDEEDGYHIEFEGLSFIKIFSYEDTFE